MLPHVRPAPPPSDFESTPPAGRLFVGAYMRSRRRALNQRLAAAADAVGISRVSLYQFEHGMGGLPPDRMVRLLHRYGVTDPNQVQNVAEALNENETVFLDFLPGALERLGACEGMATHIRSFSVQCIPFAGQTAEYTQALAKWGRWPEVMGAAMSRLDSDDERMVLLLLDERALYGRFGTPAVMAAQWAHLQRLMIRQQAEVRVLPFTNSVHRPASLVSELALHGQPAHYLYASVHLDGVVYATGPGLGAQTYKQLNDIEAAALTATESYQRLDQAREAASR